MKRQRKLSLWVFCIMLIVNMAWLITGCSDKEKQSITEQKEEHQKKDDTNTVLGEGSKSFPLTVVDKEGKETLFEIHTDKETVGEALVEVSLIAGEESEYGLFVNTVNGITIDYDKDKVYWAFYINGEYAQTGVDSTTIKEGDQYSFKIE